MISNYITNADYNQTNFKMLVGVLSHKGRREFNTFGEVQMRLLHYHTKIQQQQKSTMDFRVTENKRWKLSNMIGPEHTMY